MNRFSLNTIPRRLMVALVLYLTLLTLIVIAFTAVSNERAERFTWRTLLTNAMEAHYPDNLSAQTQAREGTILHYDSRQAPLPPAIDALGPGLRDDVVMDQQMYAVLVQVEGPYKRAVAVDATHLEERTHQLERDVAVAVVGLMVLFGLAGAWGLQRALRPFDRLMDQIGSLQPDNDQAAIVTDPNATSELHTISDAVNGYVQRNREFMAREQAFIHTASHELRTPVAVLRNELALATETTDPSQLARRLERANELTQNLDSLLNMLLVLARDPTRLAPLAESVALLTLAQTQVDHHQLLLREKELQVELTGDPVIAIHAPKHLVEVAVANLVRNAIENSDRGMISVTVSEPGTLRVIDPGHGMTPAEISQLYARFLRGQTGVQQGIGLQLLARICEHLGWRLTFAETEQGQTVAELRFVPESTV